MLTDRRAKTLFVGFDAACWRFINPLLERGLLPAMRRLIDGGIWGTLDSTLPALTPVAWASIITGKNPGKHGVFDMLQRQPGTYEFRPTNASARVGTPFWRLLNQAGIRVGLVNVPFTYPPETIDGFVVCGFGSPARAADIASPGETLGWIQNNYPRYTSRGRLKDLFKTTSVEEILVGEREHQQLQVQIAAGLAQKFEVDVLVINLMLLDHINHYAQDYEQIEQAIRDTDSDLSHLLASFGPDNVVLFSDHGSRRVQGDYLLHQWMLDSGYMVSKKRPSAEERKALHTVLVRRSTLSGKNGGWPDKVRRRFLQGALEALPESLTGSLWQNIEGSQAFARQFVHYTTALDYTLSRIYHGSTYSGNLYLNIAGREPAGFVSPDSRAGLQAELAEKLERIVDPEGRPLFTGVYASQSLYHGAAAAFAPDIVLDGYLSPWNAKITNPGLVNGSIRNHYFLAGHGDAGWHSRDGIFVFSGPAFRRGKADWKGGVMDLPATLLYLNDVPIPEDYDGSLLAEAFAEDFRNRHSIQFQPGDPETVLPFETGYDDEEAAEVMEHLRALGYVD